MGIELTRAALHQLENKRFGELLRVIRSVKPSD